MARRDLLTGYFIAMVVVSATGLNLPSVRADERVVVVDDFDGGVQNHLLGYRNPFHASPSSASTMRVADEFRGVGGRSLRITGNRGTDGFCGMWLHFFDLRAKSRKYFVSNAYDYLSFWVKGKIGGEQFIVKLADRRWIEKEDAVTAGPIDRFLGGSVTKQWQEAIVPLAACPTIDKSQLGALIFEFNQPGKNAIFIDDVSFKSSRKSIVPFSKPPKADKGEARALPKAMWVWTTKSLLKEESKCRALFEFCRRQGISILWVQLEYGMAKVDDSRQVKCTIRQQQQFRWFLRQAHQNRLKVHALDGYPEYSQAHQHHIPLAVVDGVIEFNRQSPIEERFDGIHFDNEPHLLLGWHDESWRRRILKDFLDLNAQCQRRVRVEPKLEFGIDIPFWWQDRDEKTGRCHGEVLFNGVSKPASYHCIDLLDNVGIMNYRDVAGGADGMIVHGRDLLTYGDRAKRAKIFMGVETFAYKPTDVWFAVGLPRESFMRALSTTARDQAMLSRIGGFRLYTFDDGDHVHVGIEVPNQKAGVDAERALLSIARLFGASCDSEFRLRAESIRQKAGMAAQKDSAWRRFRPREFTDPKTDATVCGFALESIMLPKITFADETHSEFQTQTTAATEFFSKSPSYGGLAIHYYESFRQLVKPGATQVNP